MSARKIKADGPAVKRVAVIGGNTVQVVDLTPSWTTCMGILLAVLQDGTPEGKSMAREELMDLARKVDAANAA